jgi:hypothetical protein
MTAVNDRFNKASQKIAEEKEREQEIRVERAERSGAITRDTLFQTFESIDWANPSSVDGAISKFESCTEVLNGGAPAPVTTPAPGVSAPMATNPTLPFDFESLPDSAKEIILKVAEEPNRFMLEPFGAIKDKNYTKLRKDSETAKAATTTPAGSTAAATTPSKKPKAKAEEPKKEASVHANQPKKGLWAGAKQAVKGAWNGS